MPKHSHSCGYGFYGFGHGRSKAPLAVIPQGNSFPVFFTCKNYREEIELIQDGWVMTAAFYDNKGNLLAKGSTKDGRITLSGSRYVLSVTHAESAGMSGAVALEISFDGPLEEVHHGHQVVRVDFTKRNNNRIIG